MQERALPLSLTGLEIVFLTDSVRNADNIPADQAEFPCVKPLILLLASVYNEVIENGAVKNIILEIAITMNMAWYLRTKVRSGDIAIDGKTNVGVPLNLKLNELIMRFEVEDNFPSALEDGEVPLTDEKKAWLKEGANATRTNPDPSPDGSAYCES